MDFDYSSSNRARLDKRSCLDYHNVETDVVNCIRIGFSIHFCDQISWNTVSVLNKMLIEIDKEMSSEVEKAKSACINKYYTTTFTPTPIELFITTYGGIVHSALSVVDTIQSLKTPVHTIVQGYTASAGTLISMAGAKRYISKNAYILIHELRCGIWGKYAEIEVHKDNASKKMDHLIDFYISQNIKMTKDELKVFLSKDVDLNATEAINLGLAEKVYDKTCRT